MKNKIRFIRFSTVLVMVVIFSMLTLAACSSTSSPTPTATGSQATSASRGPTSTAGGATNINLTAQNLSFDQTTITVPAGAQVTINFSNKDSGVTHNFAVYTDSSASNKIFVGDMVSGPGNKTYTFTAPSKPGTYFFRCDVHPTQMTGQFIVQ